MLVATCIAALFIQRIGSDLTVNDYLSPNIALISVAVFVFFLNSNVNQKISDRAKRVITKVSNCTFGIYLIHALFIYLFIGEKLFIQQCCSRVYHAPVENNHHFCIELGCCHDS